MVQHEIQRLLPRHYKILTMCLSGLKSRDIALAMDMSEAGISLIVNSPLFQDELAKRRDKQIKRDEEVESHGALDILERAAISAAQKHVDLLGSESDRIAQISANAILDRVIQRKGDDGQVIQLDKGIINLLQVTINELKEVKSKSDAPMIERQDAEVV